MLFVKAKTLAELIQPVEKRIEDVKEFLNSIDKTLIYEVVPIADAYGPTKSDPDLDVRKKIKLNHLTGFYDEFRIRKQFRMWERLNKLVIENSIAS